MARLGRVSAATHSRNYRSGIFENEESRDRAIFDCVDVRVTIVDGDARSLAARSFGHQNDNFVALRNKFAGFKLLEF
jgi:hypothetical protein